MKPLKQENQWSSRATENVWMLEPTENFWKRINNLINYSKNKNIPTDVKPEDEREFLKACIHDYEQSSYNQHYLAAIDDLHKYGYIGEKDDDTEALLLKSIIAVSEKKQSRPLWEILHMIIFNKANYRRFFETYLPLPSKIRNFLGRIIAKLENQQMAIKNDLRLKGIWAHPESAAMI